MVSLQTPGLGDIQAVERNGRHIGIHGGSWFDGVLNLNLTWGLTPAGYEPYDGASYIQIVSLGREGPTAYGRQRQPHVIRNLFKERHVRYAA